MDRTKKEKTIRQEKRAITEREKERKEKERIRERENKRKRE